MRRKSGEPLFYDAKAAVSPGSVLPLLLVTFVFALVTASFGRYSFFNLLPLAAYPLYLTTRAGVNLERMGRKLLPLSLFIFFIGVWNVFLDKGQITLFGLTIGAGWLSFATIAMKFLLTVSAVLALFSLTGFDSVCRSLASHGLPAILADQLFLFYRYISLITDETRNIIRARLFRGGSVSVSQSGNICGPLVLRCASRSRRIHDALACRGCGDMIYDGKGTSTGTRARFSDKIFVVVWILLFLAIRFDLASVVGDYVLRYASQ